MNKYEYLVSLLPKVGIDQATIDSEIQIYLDAGEWGEAVIQAASYLQEQETVPEEVEQALRDAYKGMEELEGDISRWYTWRYPTDDKA